MYIYFILYRINC